MSEIKEVNIAVAYLQHGNEILISWNDRWDGFTFPMTKLKEKPTPESPEHAALRAAAEVLKLPVLPKAGATTQYQAIPQVSYGDEEFKVYHFHVVQVEIHPDFINHNLSHLPIFWASPKKLMSNEYQPLSMTTNHLLEACKNWGWL